MAVGIGTGVGLVTNSAISAKAARDSAKAAQDPANKSNPPPGKGLTKNGNMNVNITLTPERRVPGPNISRRDLSRERKLVSRYFK